MFLCLCIFFFKYVVGVFVVKSNGTSRARRCFNKCCVFGMSLIFCYLVLSSGDVCLSRVFLVMCLSVESLSEVYSVCDVLSGCIFCMCLRVLWMMDGDRCGVILRMMVV